MGEPVVIVHGGCGRVADELQASAVQGVAEAVRAAQEALRSGGGCEDAAVAAVRHLEADPAFNAGHGACMTADGTFELDAALMRSRDLRSGAVAAVPDVADAIRLARLVLEQTDHCLMVGAGAIALARAHGVGTWGRDQVWTAKAQAQFDGAQSGRMAADGRADTVGAVVLDRDGHLCAAGSTGGVLMKRPGRVGDTPLVGSGLYAHPRLGAACATGKGEAIATHVMSFAVLQRIAGGDDPQDAAELLCHEVARAERATCGLLVLTPDGRVAVAHASRHMSWAIGRGLDAAPQCGLAWPS